MTIGKGVNINAKWSSGCSAVYVDIDCGARIKVDAFITLAAALRLRDELTAAIKIGQREETERAAADADADVLRHG